MVKCVHEPVEQVRGNMGPGDYFDAISNSLDEPKYARLGEDYHEQVEIHDDSRRDTRIVCKKCFLSTGWMKIDFPGAPLGLGLAAVRAKWDEIKDLDPEEYNARWRASGKKSKLVSLPA